MHNRFYELLDICIKKQATDVHFQIQNNDLIIFIRTSLGLLKMDVIEDDFIVFEQLKYESNLDLSNQSLPQTGAFHIIYLGKTFYFRFALVYSFEICSGVLRILNLKPKSSVFRYQKPVQTHLNQMINFKSGLILLSGPTCSGKTTTLYNLIENLEHKKIYTVEDPIEVIIPSVIQLQVNLQKGFTYDAAIKQLLRHDPDIIVLGEIRSEMDAKMAIRAALTGHLVLSTIHAKSCLGAIKRLLDFNIQSYELKEVLLCLSSQRLVLHKNKKEKFVLYEFFDQNDIQYVLEFNKPSEKFESFQEKLQVFKQRNLITKKEYI